MEFIQRNHPRRKDSENYDKELKENREIINTLTENNEALNLRVNTLTNKLTEKEEEIDNLTSDNNYLKSELNKWKNRFLKIIKNSSPPNLTI